MSGTATIEMAGVTDRGRLRERNEDDLALDAELGVGVVADGMGGLRDGHLASRQAVEAVMAHLRAAAGRLDGAALGAALEAANERVCEHSRQRPSGMGTTAVAFAIDGDVCRLAHVGDSRAYLLHAGELNLVTRDHSMVQELVDRGLLTPEAARQSPSRNVITRAIGLEGTFQPEFTEVAVAPGDLLLLCSDGLWDMLEDQRIAALLRGCGAGVDGLEQGAAALVAAANEAGGLDNITVLLARL